SSADGSVVPVNGTSRTGAPAVAAMSGMVVVTSGTANWLPLAQMSVAVQSLPPASYRQAERSTPFLPATTRTQETAAPPPLLRTTKVFGCSWRQTGRNRAGSEMTNVWSGGSQRQPRVGSASKLPSAVPFSSKENWSPASQELSSTSKRRVSGG